MTIPKSRIPVSIEDEMKRSYMDYAMSVIIGRALPDVRDGLKPAHRRALYGMRLMGLASNRPYRKCAKIVGEVMGNFHPHGDQAIYDTIVRLAQDFSMRYALVDAQGNFGSIDGDPPAAMRYTEARLESLAEAMMVDLDKETVDFGPNYDDTTWKSRSVLPVEVPQPAGQWRRRVSPWAWRPTSRPHNMGEVIDATSPAHRECRRLVRGEARPAPMHHRLRDPDFPHRRLLSYGLDGASSQAYLTGRGSLTDSRQDPASRTWGKNG